VVLVVAVVVGAVVVLSDDSDTEGDQVAKGLAPSSTNSPAAPSAGGETPSAEALDSVEPDSNDNVPEDVVDSFLTASVSADCDTLGEVLAEWDEQSVETCRNNRTPNPNPAEVLDIRFEDYFQEPDPTQADMEPGTAVVVATMAYNQGPGDWTFWLRLDDGLWRIYLDIPA